MKRTKLISYVSGSKTVTSVLNSFAVKSPSGNEIFILSLTFTWQDNLTPDSFSCNVKNGSSVGFTAGTSSSNLNLQKPHVALPPHAEGINISLLASVDNTVSSP